VGWIDRFDSSTKRLQRASIPTLIEALKVADSAVSWPARQALESRARKAVPALIRALMDPQPDARRNAAQVLGSIASRRRAKALTPAAVPALVGITEDPIAPVSFTAVMALAAIEPRHPAIVPALVRHAREKNPLIAAFLGEVWNSIGLLNEAVPAGLAELSRGPEPEVREAARKARRRLARQKRNLATRVPRILEALEAPGERTRYQAILKLSRLPPYSKSVLPGLVKALRDKSDHNRILAAIGLGAMGLAAREAAPALARVLEDGDAVVRSAAAESLGMIGDESALPALSAALSDESPEVSSAAAEAIDEIRSLKAPRSRR
jgi:HEAT repeat protein